MPAHTSVTSIVPICFLTSGTPRLSVRAAATIGGFGGTHIAIQRKTRGALFAFDGVAGEPTAYPIAGLRSVFAGPNRRAELIQYRRIDHPHPGPSQRETQTLKPIDAVQASPSGSMTAASRRPRSTFSMLASFSDGKSTADPWSGGGAAGARAVVCDEAPYVKGAVFAHARAQSQHRVGVPVARQKTAASFFMACNSIHRTRNSRVDRGQADGAWARIAASSRSINSAFGPLSVSVVVQVADGVVRFFGSIAEHVRRAP